MPTDPRRSRQLRPQAFALFLAATVLSAAPPPGVAPSADAPVAPATIAKPLIAHWTFDEDFGQTCRDRSGSRLDARPANPKAPGYSRTQGLFGNALAFSGSHKLHIPGKPDLDGLEQISLSAWTMPTDLSVYREIFRKEDGDSRVLFSYQLDGTILSLGLNVNGYVECDAKVDPEVVLDGDWHHCAATFDGRRMRVFFDGRLVGALEREGTIAAGGEAPGCIGSSNGGECFQGAMDDLRIYRQALSDAEVAQLHANGRAAMEWMSRSAPAAEPAVAVPLLAHWTFNERGWATTIRETSGKDGLDVTTDRVVPRTKGVHGHALDLRGEHSLATAPVAGPNPRTAISFSAWTRPTDVGGYREIFRQECGERLLFSFQHDGTVLSLGLNVGGYVECDAQLEPKQVLDGTWHHCAGTFDGQHMRVYLDGREIGSSERPGQVAANGRAPCFIGSSGGRGEYFHGGLDDLRVYGEALSPDDVRSLYRAGVKALEQATKAMEEQLAAVYTARPSFAETVARARQNIAENRITLTRDLAGAIVAGLKRDFAADHANFVAWSGLDPVEILIAEDDTLLANTARTLVGMLLEYRPLTDRQKRAQTAEEARAWERAEEVRRKLERLEADPEGQPFSPGWIRIILQAGEGIEFRPAAQEPVAPYNHPVTPVTRSLTPEETEGTLERDWLHQAGGNPAPKRIQDEIRWAKELAGRIGAASPRILDFAEERRELEQLSERAATTSEPDADLYLQVRRVKRRIAFANSLLDFDRVLLVDMPYPQGSEWRHETRHRLGYMAVPGGRLLVLDGLSPAGKLTQLMPQPPLHGSFWRPDLDYDGRTVVFCFKPHNEKSFHLYEIGVDGSGLRQLTDGPYDDFDPVSLPDGEHVLFSTTRGHTYVRCMPPTNAYVLARCDRDGSSIYLVSRNNEPDYLPSVMNDGRVIYTRWEYTDKPLWRAQALWTMNPDGTQVSTFWGNQSVWPDLLKDARSIPGSRRVMFTGSAHHNWFAGSVGIIDPDKGLNFPHGLTKVTADLAWPESGNGAVDPVESPRYHSSGSYSAYYSPYPLGEHDFLVSACRNGKFVLYLMDADGNRELVHEGVNNVFHAIPVRPRTRPPVVEDRVRWPRSEGADPPQQGVIYSGNVYQGAPAGLQGKAKHLRVLSIEHKTYTYWHKRPYLSTGPVVSAVQSEGVKRIFGTVPIETDGSVAFVAPTGKALHFQLLDGSYRALQTMRSFTGVMPGESRGCLGCHEMHSAAPQPGRRAKALLNQPRPITPPPWPSDTVSFPRYVQPVLDRYCGTCHQGEGKAREKLDLTDRPGFLVFSEPYVTLIGKPSWGKPYEEPKVCPPGWGIADMLMVEAYDQRDPKAYQTPEPMTRLSYRSRLIDIAGSGKHNDVRVDPVSLRRLIAWVDAMCPYRGDEEVRQIPDPEFQGVDWLAVRPRIQTAPRINRPGPVD